MVETAQKKWKVGVLGSTRGTSLLPLLKAYKQSKLPDIDFRIVVSNREHSGILDKARAYGVAASHIPVKGATREAYDQAVAGELHKHEVNLILLVGYMRIVSAQFVAQWRNRIVNIHPSLLPRHKGLMDLQVHQAVIDQGEPESGCSLHLVTEAVDDGPVILQLKCDVSAQDDAESLKAKVQALEAQAFLKFLEKPQSYLSEGV